MSQLACALGRDPIGEFDPRWEMAGFSAAYRNASSQTDYVVAMARAAPRLLELFELLSEPGREVICEHTIDYLPRNTLTNKRVLLFDDTINFGSCMAAMKDRLLSLGAQVDCFAAVVDSVDYLGETETTEQAHSSSPHLSTLKARWYRKLSHADVVVFHNCEVRAFRTLGKPYTVDFPIFEMRLRPEIAEFTPSALAALLGETPANSFFQPFTTIQVGAAIYPLSVPLKSKFLQSLLVAPRRSVTFLPYSKLRLYFDLDRLVMRFAPMVQIETRLPIDGIALADPAAEKTRRLLIEAVERGCSKTDEERVLASHRVLVYALSVALGRAAWRGFLGTGVAPYLESGASATLSSTDTRLLLGSALASKVLDGLEDDEQSSACTTLPREAIGHDSFSVESICNSDPSAVSSNPELFSQLLIAMNAPTANPDWRPRDDRDAVENVAMLLPLLRKAIDRDRRTSTPGAQRLHAGLTFQDMLLLLYAQNAPSQIAALSFAIDILVDGGMLVPHLLFFAATNTIARAYRSGENDTADPTTQLKSIIHGLLTERQDLQHPPLSEKGFAKTFAILKRLWPRNLPWTLGMKTYGVEPIVDDSALRDWCTRHGIIEVIDQP